MVESFLNSTVKLRVLFIFDWYSFFILPDVVSFWGSQSNSITIIYLFTCLKYRWNLDSSASRCAVESGSIGLWKLNTPKLLLSNLIWGNIDNKSIPASTIRVYAGPKGSAYLFYSLRISRALARGRMPRSSWMKRRRMSCSFIPSTSRRRVLWEW